MQPFRMEAISPLDQYAIVPRRAGTYFLRERRMRAGGSDPREIAETGGRDVPGRGGVRAMTARIGARQSLACQSSLLEAE